MSTFTDVSSNSAETHQRLTATADDARTQLAHHASDAADLRELGLMLGLLEIGEDGGVAKANPWDSQDLYALRS